MSELDRAIPVAFPLRGEWVALRSPGSRIPSHGTDLLGQRYAFDLWRVDSRAGGYHPASTARILILGVRTRECYGWGEPVHSATDGEVVIASDGMADPEWIHPVRQLLGVLVTTIRFRPAMVRQVAGNHVIVRGRDAFATYAHLAEGSVAVGQGQQVREGDLIGRVGHTGNSTAPHLHFQLSDRADAAAAQGIPCSFREYQVLRDGQWQVVRDSIPLASDRIKSVGSSM
jgi:murein DD-endopeptidase MepM/ murein hydrolase activator NlpD